MGHTVCALSIDDEDQWGRLSLGGGAIGGLKRMGKYLIPAGPDARLPPVFADANSYRLHYCLMSSGFAPLFPGLTTADHASLIMTHARREFYAGAVYEFPEGATPRFGFAVETALRQEEMLDHDTVYGVYRQLSDRFAVGDLGYLPRGTLQETAASAWTDPAFEILSVSDDAVPYEAYTPGIAYGRLRLFSEDSAVSWQDIVVFDEVPLDFEGVIAGAITGQRQDILSHLNVLSAQRGSPNFFVDDAVDLLTQFEGELVRVEAERGNYKLRAATQEEAEAFWEQQRPAADVENPADTTYTELDAFADIPTSTVEDRDASRSRFGAKTVGLATLSTLIAPELQTPGLGVPFHYYDAFMRDNAWEVDLGSGLQTATYAETITAWLADAAFATDASVRRARLSELREHMRTFGQVDPELLTALRDGIVDQFGDASVMVRVRSSSNAEDTPTFNGAGLYDSTSACAADSFAPGDLTASLCDPDKAPRTLTRGLTKVWASLWNFGAFEEREFYQLDHTQIAMGATVSMRFEDELANGVAFTGSPLDRRETRFVINAQYGETDVVSPTPGVSAELSFLTLEEGSVTDINRVVSSSLVADGETVMTDAQLEALGSVMAELQSTYPIDTIDGTTDPILDLEFKLTHEGALVIKQIRAFSPSPYASDPTCRD